MKSTFLITLIVLLLGVGQLCFATTWYCDPVNGSTSGDGTINDPWTTLTWVVSNNKIETMRPQSYPYSYGDPLVVYNDGASVQPGDTIELLSGDHGDVYIQANYNSDWITIKAASGHTPIVRRFQFRGGCKWAIDGVTVSQEPYGTLGTTTAVNFENHGWHGPCYDCKIENSTIYGVDDTSSYTASDWLSNTPGAGVSSGGPRNIIRNNTIRNIQLGVSVGGDDSVIEYNTLEGIAHDGFRSAGNRIVWQYNHLSDFVDVDANHDDMLQMYRGGGVAHEDVEIRGNFFDGRMISGRALTTSPQGIGCFDGPYVDCIVENNVVLTAHYHGITLNDADGCIIINNTVMDPSRNYPAWIRVPDEDAESQDCIIRNNLGYSIPAADPDDNIVVDYNIQLTDTLSNSIFVDWQNGDVHLASGSSAIDAGSSSYAPSVDIEGNSRPQGQGYDIGAYEYDSQDIYTIEGNVADQVVRSDGTFKWVNQADGRIGGGVAGADGALVFVFELPELATGQTVADASLDFTLLSYSYGNPGCNADLYGLDFRTSASILASDFYQGAFGGDTDAAAIQNDIMLVTEPVGPIATDSTGEAALAAYLSSQYSAGAEEGDYVFLRVNPDSLNVPDWRYWVVATADNATQSNRPVLTMTLDDGNLNPFADAGSDQVVTDSDGDGSASVTLDGSGSADGDGTVSSYVWQEDSTQIATGSSPSVSMDLGIHIVDLTVTDDDSATDDDTSIVTVVSRTLTSSASPYTWPASTLPTQTGVFTCEFDMVANASLIDGVTGLASGAADWWTDLACIVRFNTSGYIDVRDGGSYTSDVSLAYTSSTTYHVRMVVDVPNATYSVYVTPDGGSEATLATDYDFRTEQQDVTSIDDWTLNAANSVGTHTVSNLTITD